MTVPMGLIIVIHIIQVTVLFGPSRLPLIAPRLVDAYSVVTTPRPTHPTVVASLVTPMFRTESGVRQTKSGRRYCYSWNGLAGCDQGSSCCHSEHCCT